MEARSEDSLPYVSVYDYPDSFFCCGVGLELVGCDEALVWADDEAVPDGERSSSLPIDRAGLVELNHATRHERVRGQGNHKRERGQPKSPSERARRQPSVRARWGGRERRESRTQPSTQSAWAGGRTMGYRPTERREADGLGSAHGNEIEGEHWVGWTVVVVVGWV